MKIELPDKFAASLKPAEVLLDLAAGMYAAQHLTLGQAAELAGVSHGRFQQELGNRRIVANYDLDDLAQDLQAVNELKRS